MLIANELVEHTEMWQALKQKINTLHHHVTTVYSNLQPLIVYLENAMMQPGVELDKQISWITVVQREVIDLNKGFTDFYTNKVQKFIFAANLLDLMSLPKDFDIFSAAYN